MGRTYILGNEQSLVWAGQLGEFVQIPAMTINDHAKTHHFVVSQLSAAMPDDKVIIDLDSTDPALALTIAMHIRLSVSSLKTISFLPILLVSYLPLQSFLALGECSQFFLAQSGYAFCSPVEANSAIKELSSISADQFTEDFLDRIQIRPDANIGPHSMANQWGADLLNRIISKDDTQETEEISRQKSTLYYKYIFLSTTPLNAILHDEPSREFRRNERCVATGKKILLIDDEADKGWSAVMSSWFLGHAVFEVISHPVKDFEDLPEPCRSKVVAGFYDLYLLDLRMLGTQEEDIYDTNEFSGMKILKAIKRHNQGNQVIIMTASNKAWNMKSLIAAGADGYYIKESPEMKLPRTFSEANFRSFSRDVNKALNSGYKKNAFSRITALVQHINTGQTIDSDLATEITNTLQAANSQLQYADTSDEFAYSYLTLFQVFESLSHYYLSPENNGWLIDNQSELCHYNTNGLAPIRENPVTDERPSIMSRVTGIYVDVGHGTDCHFIRENIGLAIVRRNAFVHHDEAKLSQARIAKVYKPDGFMHLLATIDTLLRMLV